MILVKRKPVGIGVKTDSSTSLLHAARRAGLHIRNNCGGPGAGKPTRGGLTSVKIVRSMQ